ncbi:anti-sigma factor [Daejeonella oryzae]|uniref:anti-sigma factor n=1 Tax=Daejeonella oryzae TaxID=1122943 RepID=UPI000409781F|nr:anti-sigma factor [Daejeonella oryzae]
MEDIQSYIESGILELYVMGDLSPEEKLKVEQMAVQHPEIRTEIASIESGLEHYASAYAVSPSANLRERVLNQLEKSETVTNLNTTTVTSINSAKSNTFYKYAFAASVALLLLSTIALFVLYTRLQESNQQLAILETNNQQFSNRVNFMIDQLDQTQQTLNILRSPEVKLIKLAGTKQAPQASMMVAFNPVKEEVMIDMSAMKMPENDTTHQYQLWAMVDGKPVDLGVFDMKTDDSGMKKMKTVTNAQAFAVTLEPRGGSVNPTMDQMMVIGSI